MGFFSDLKEDLSQAVNELMPEETSGDMLNGVPKETPDDMLDGVPKEMPDDMLDGVPKEMPSDMLDQLEEPGDAGEPLEEEVISPDDAERATDDTAWTSDLAPADGLSEETLVSADDTSWMSGVEETVSAEEPPTEEDTAADGDTAAEEEESNTISVSGGEEEKKMDAQTQTQVNHDRVAVDETAVVTEGMTITGDIISEGSMELIGTVNGNLDILGKLNITGTIQGDSKAAEIFAEGARITGEVNSQGSVKIGQSSVVIGNITATSAVIAGAVKGDIDVHGPVILDTTAIVMGNIKSKSVQINNGAVIEGLCSQCYADVNPTSFFEEFKKKK